MLSGCATSFQGNNLSSVKKFPAVQSAKSISVDLAFTGKLNGEPWTAKNTHNTAYLKKNCIEHLNDSGMFGDVAPELKNPDLTLQVAIINEKISSKSRQLLTAWTLFIYPYKSSDNFRLLAVLENPKTGRKEKIQLEDDVTHYQQLLMAPLALFKPYGSSLEKCKSRLFDNLCLEIEKTGMLK
jgi:hypothetical protein